MATHLVKVIGARRPVSVSGRRDERIAAIAGLQRGRVNRQQLRMAGISDTTITRLASSGWLIPLHRCVFAVGHDASTELGDETAALLAMCDGAALNDATAAMLWGMTASRPELIHLVTPASSAQLRGVHVHRTRILEPQDVRIHRGLPVTSPARTLLDRAESLAPRPLELELDQALITRIMSTAELSELLQRAAGRAGAGRLRALLERQHGPQITRSAAEELFLRLVRQAGLPEPEVNVRLHGYEVDFLWREARVVVEIDGFRFHSSRRSFESDRRKDATLQAAGFLTIRITWTQMQSEALAVIARLAATLGRRG